jgi:chorismate lyase/3-hydroxybenzoate synthase
MRLAMNGAVLFGYRPGTELPGESLDALIYRIYRHILGHIRALGYPHLLRVWNYFPGINRDQDGLERYQRFCLGRYQAFTELEADFQHHLPAATAIGTRSGPCQVYFLAGQWPGLHVENPRQVSAYRYPPRYGPKSPSFARATLYDTGRERHLFIAGTSSIIGHASRHPGDPYRQAVETLRNIEAVVAAARALRDPGGLPIGLTGRAADPRLKVYVRHPEDYPAVCKAFAGHPSFPARCLFLAGDICRADLLVEAEALVTEPRA